MNWELASLAVLWAVFFGVYFLFVRGSALQQKKADSLWQEGSRPDRMDERRRYRRRYLPFPVRYASLEQADFQNMALTRDVGKGGIQFPASHPLRQGSRLYLSIELPKTSSPLSLFGEVVWQTSGPRFETGIKFVGLSTANVIRIARHL